MARGNNTRRRRSNQRKAVKEYKSIGGKRKSRRAHTKSAEFLHLPQNSANNNSSTVQDISTESCKPKECSVATECPAPDVYAFVQNLTNAGLVVRSDTPRDGNCFFHAIHDQLLRIQSPKNAITTSDLRSFCIKFLHFNPSLPDGTLLRHFTGFDNWNGYLIHMATDRVWVDDVVVLAMACVLRRPIVIITNVRDNKTSYGETTNQPTASGPQSERLIRKSPCVVMNPFPTSTESLQRKPLLLGLLSGHYLSLEPINSERIVKHTKKKDKTKNSPTRARCFGRFSNQGNATTSQKSKASRKRRISVSLSDESLPDRIQRTVCKNESKSSVVSFMSISSLELTKEMKFGKATLRKLTDNRSNSTKQRKRRRQTQL